MTVFYSTLIDDLISFLLITGPSLEDLRRVIMENARYLTVCSSIPDQCISPGRQSCKNVKLYLNCHPEDVWNLSEPYCVWTRSSAQAWWWHKSWADLAPSSARLCTSCWWSNTVSWLGGSWTVSAHTQWFLWEDIRIFMVVLCAISLIRFSMIETHSPWPRCEGLCETTHPLKSSVYWVLTSSSAVLVVITTWKWRQ